MWYEAEATERPIMLDTTSSKVYNYVRKNVTETQHTDEMTGETYTVWVFEEMKIPKDSWALYKAVERNTANIDYIAMMKDVELEEGEEDE